MRTIGWLLILASLFVFRSSLAGRVQDLPKDLSDGFLAIVRGDTDALGEVLARSGDGLTANEADVAKYQAQAGDGGPPVANTGLAAKAISLGKAAKGYRWTATGPDYYDCSGLMWRACKDLGIYTGPRFTTYNVRSLSAFTEVKIGAINDIVVWPTHHMGVVTGEDQFYSARSTRSGIGYAKISTWRNGAKPTFLRPSKGAK